MHVFLINNQVNQGIVKYTPSFKRGLTPEIVDYVKNMDREEYKNIKELVWKKYGIVSHVGASNAVTYCLEKTAQIMSSAGFKLPKTFSFEALESNLYGEYNQYNNVCINSNKKEFLDLEELDKMEEDISRRKKEPLKKHFLDTYIHEFLHAAHCNNIMDKYGEVEGKDIFFYKMASLIPCDIIKKLSSEYSKRDSIFKDCKGLLLADNLPEYFAEKNTILISEKLGNDFNISNITADFFKQSMNRLERDIWNGNIQRLEVCIKKI